ncbi:hypothetical protein BJY01DRAFT_119246 [Aspergillus pseudoustus]|uniref:Integral membrane protein n=1 Tax=Aspergillus pseudoustus TaxID=1810923 RepID=A0ABR4IRG5_9EURO
MPSNSGTSGSWPLASRSLPTLFYLTLAFSSTILTQDVSLLPSAASDSFPACGLTCPNLIQADDACTPPTTAVTNQQTYVTCFCQSALLAAFQTTPWGTCDTVCTTQADATLLQQWYNNFCANGGNTEDTDTSSDTDDETEDSTTGSSNSNNSNNNSNNSNNNSDSNSNNTDSTNSTAAADTASSSASGSRNNPQPQSWWDGHYKWVIMVIVLIVGFSTIAAVGIWLKKRHDAKHPNLYHGHESGSRVSSNRNFDSPVPGPLPQAAAVRRHESMNTVSIASSSRTNVIPTRPAIAPSRLQKVPQGLDDVEIREAPR